MFENVDKKKVVTYGVIITFAIVMYLLLSNFSAIKEVILVGIGIVSSIIIGFIIAYVFNMPMKYIEERILSKTKVPDKFKRISALIITIVLIVVLFIGIFSFAIPQLGESIDIVVDNMPTYIKVVQNFVDDNLSKYNISTQITDKIVESWKSLLESLSAIVMNIVESLYSFVAAIFSGIFNALLSSILAIYMLLSKEKLTLTLKKVLFAFVPIKGANGFLKVLKIMNRSFENFIRGQILEAFIIGILTFIGMTIFRFDYALLISVIVGITNMIPIFGPYIGGTPAFLLLFIVSPTQALWFVVFLIGLQQVEGNIIYPRVVGSSMGLSGFWVLVAVIIGNNMFGIMGIIIGIPIFSTIYTLIREITTSRLKKKKIVIKGEN